MSHLNSAAERLLHPASLGVPTGCCDGVLCASKDSVISSKLWRLISPLPTAVFLSRTKDRMHFQKRMSHNGLHPAVSRGFSCAPLAPHPGCKCYPSRKVCLFLSREVLLEVRGYPDSRRPWNSWKVERSQANFRIWQSTENRERGQCQNGPMF